MIPLSEPYVASTQKQLVLDCLERNWLASGGDATRALEKEFASFCDVKYAQTCSNGTAALHLALMACDVQPGDEVILPALNSQYALFAVYHARANPVLIDVNEDWSPNVEQLTNAITKKTKAIIVAHLFGFPIDLQNTIKIANDFGVKVIEDCAEAHGAHFLGQPVGSIGDVGTFSFYANKIIASGEGGICVTDDPEISKKISYYKNQTFNDGMIKTFMHEDIGYNYRLGEVAASVALSQLREIDLILRKRDNVSNIYNSILSSYFDIKRPSKYSRAVTWMYLLNIEGSNISADKAVEVLLQNGLMTRKFFPSLHLQPCLKKFDNPKSEEIILSEKISKSYIYLPTFTNMQVEQVKSVCSVVIDSLIQRT